MTFMRAFWPIAAEQLTPMSSECQSYSCMAATVMTRASLPAPPTFGHQLAGNQYAAPNSHVSSWRANIGCFSVSLDSKHVAFLGTA